MKTHTSLSTAPYMNYALVRVLQGGIMTPYPNTLAFQQKAASCCQSLKSVLGYQQGVAFYFDDCWRNMTMTHNTLAKICAAISGSSIVYMFLITYEGTYFGWTVFFVFLAFAILFHTLGEKEEEITRLRSPEEKQEEERRWKEHRKELAEVDPRSNDPFYGSSVVLSQEEKDKILNKFKKKEEMQAVFFRKNPKKPNKDPNHNETRK